MKHATKIKLINDDTMQAKYNWARFNVEFGLPSSESRPPIQIIRMKELTVMLGLSRSTIYNKMNKRSPYHDPLFPPALQLGSGTRAIGWLLSDILQWVKSL
ncbi:Prophage CP4-57 regulatory protein (AlpA) [compost metagenome]